MSQTEQSKTEFPETISFDELYKLVQKAILDIKAITDKVVNVETQLGDLKEEYIISNKFSEQEAVEISKNISELMKTLSTVLVNLASKNIVAEIRFDAKAGSFSVQFFKYVKQNEGNTN